MLGYIIPVSGVSLENYGFRGLNRCELGLRQLLLFFKIIISESG